MAKLLLGKEVTDALNADLQTRTAALRERCQRLSDDKAETNGGKEPKWSRKKFYT